MRNPVLCLVYTATITITSPTNKLNTVVCINPDLCTSDNPITLSIDKPLITCHIWSYLLLVTMMTSLVPSSLKSAMTALDIGGCGRGYSTSIVPSNELSIDIVFHPIISICVY